MSNKSNLTVSNTDTQRDQLSDVEIDSADTTIKADSADNSANKTSKAKPSGKKPANASSKVESADNKKQNKAKVIAKETDSSNIKVSSTSKAVNDLKSSESDNDSENSIKNANVVATEGHYEADKLDTDENALDSQEPIIIVGGASEYVFEPEEENEPSEEYKELDDEQERITKEKSLRIIEGGGKEIVIDDAPSISERTIATPACTRNKVKDKKIGDIGTYIAIGFFVITIIISLFNIKGMRYPLSCFFLSLAALTMGVTTVLRLLNNKKCDCTTCKTQNKTFLYSAGLWFLVFLGALIAFLVLILK